jgi:hypothetical protein
LLYLWKAGAIAGRASTLIDFRITRKPALACFDPQWPSLVLPGTEH